MIEPGGSVKRLGHVHPYTVHNVLYKVILLR